MPLSQAGLQSVLASSTRGTFLECLTIAHSQLSTVRLVNDTQDLVRSAGTYARFPFQVTAPAQTSERPPQIQITADLVDQRLMTALRSLAGLRERATIVYEVVLADSPDTIEYGPVSFQYESMNTDGVTQVTLQASFLKAALNDAFPAGRFAPYNASAA